MAKNISKIYKRAAFMLLAIIATGLLNICLFAFQAKAAATPASKSIINFSYDNSGDCVAEPELLPRETINRPAAPMPECCLAQNRYYNAVVNTANDKSTPAFIGSMILSANYFDPKNNFTHFTSRLAYPPPENQAIASTVIRE